MSVCSPSAPLFTEAESRCRLPRLDLSPEQYKRIGKILVVWEAESEFREVDPDDLSALEAGGLPEGESGDAPAVLCAVGWPCGVVDIDLVSANLRDAIGSELLAEEEPVWSSPTFDSEPAASR